VTPQGGTQNDQPPFRDPRCNYAETKECSGTKWRQAKTKLRINKQVLQNSGPARPMRQPVDDLAAVALLALDLYVTQNCARYVELGYHRSKRSLPLWQR